jgi:hypothetical protein
MSPARTRSVRIDAETDARVLRVLAHMRAADPFRDTNETDAIRVLLRRGAADYEREHGLPAPDAAPAPDESTPARSKASAKKGAKRTPRKA